MKPTPSRHSLTASRPVPTAPRKNQSFCFRFSHFSAIYSPSLCKIPLLSLNWYVHCWDSLSHLAAAAIVTQHEPSPSSASSSVNQTLCSWANFGSGWRRINSFFPLKKNGEGVYKSVSVCLPYFKRSLSIIFLYHAVSSWILRIQ
jgi:hypothetical protein